MSSTLLNNRYQVLETLGAGGFGKTFLSEDTQMPSRRKCVIKQLKPIENNPEVYKLVQDRFHREAATLESLGNVNGQIPDLYAYFQENEQFYLIQEWIEGVTLLQKVQREGCLPEATVRDILAQLLPVLSYVHSRQIIHRDIKPDNIIVRSRDQKPVLIDFGAVRETMGTVVNSEGHATSSIVIGTPGFMASEQAAGRAIYSSDLYSLGLTMIYLLTGKPPQELDLDPRTGDIAWRHYAQVSPEFAAVLDKAIQYSPRDRFATADEMLAAIPGTVLQSGTNEIRDRYPLPATDVGSSVPETIIPEQTSNVAGVYEFDASVSSDSYDSTATGQDKPVPPDVPGWNWGAFCLPGFWCFNNQVWVGLIAWTFLFTGGLGWLVMGAILGTKGNEWAWKSRSWRSLEAFKANQRAWAIGGAATWGGLVALIVILAAIGSQIEPDTASNQVPETDGNEAIEPPPPPNPTPPPATPTPVTPPETGTTGSGTLTNIQSCILPEPETVCDSDRLAFPAKVESILVSADLNAPVGTSIQINWQYLGGPGGTAEQIDTISLTKDTPDIDYVWTRLPAPPSGFWPVGEYAVEFIILTNNNETIEKVFSIQ
jgi:serine/threonine-protein kinase